MSEKKPIWSGAWTPHCSRPTIAPAARSAIGPRDTSSWSGGAVASMRLSIC